MNAGRSFFSSADDAFGIFRFVTMDANDKVGPIIKGECRLELERFVDAPVEIFGGLTVPGVHGVPFFSQPSSHFILCGQWVAARPGNFSTCGSNGFDENSGLFGYVQAASDAHPSEGLGAFSLSLEFCQNRHSSSGPINEE